MFRVSGLLCFGLGLFRVSGILCFGFRIMAGELQIFWAFDICVFEVLHQIVNFSAKSIGSL